MQKISMIHETLSIFSSSFFDAEKWIVQTKVSEMFWMLNFFIDSIEIFEQSSPKYLILHTVIIIYLEYLLIQYSRHE